MGKLRRVRLSSYSDHTTGRQICQHSLPVLECQVESFVLKTRLGKSEFRHSYPARPRLDLNPAKQKSAAQSKNACLAGEGGVQEGGRGALRSPATASLSFLQDGESDRPHLEV